jgi:copper(I)-binding protein
MKKLLPLIVIASLAVALAACAAPATPSTSDAGAADTESTSSESPEADLTEGELTVTNVLANMTLPTDTGSVWMVITNGTDTDDALTGAEIPGCGVVELHDMKMDGNVMVMRPVEGGQIPIPAGEMVELKKGGLHVMCIEKEAPLEVGSTVDIVLHFANAGDISVTGEVVEPGASGMQMQGEGNMQGEGKMNGEGEGQGKQSD